MRKFVGVERFAFQAPQPEPLRAKTIKQRTGTRILQHALHLRPQHGRFVERPAIGQRAVAAIAEIVYFVEKNPDKAKAAIAKAMRTKDEEALQSSYNVYAKEIVDRTMTVPGKSVAEAVDLARESGTVIRRKPEELYDNSFVANLEKSGFLKEIWGSENYKR